MLDTINNKEYRIQCYVTSSYTPDMMRIITIELPNSKDWKGYQREWEKVENSNRLPSVEV